MPRLRHEIGDDDTVRHDEFFRTRLLILQKLDPGRIGEFVGSLKSDSDKIVSQTNALVMAMEGAVTRSEVFDAMGVREVRQLAEILERRNARMSGGDRAGQRPPSMRQK